MLFTHLTILCLFHKVCNALHLNLDIRQGGQMWICWSRCSQRHRPPLPTYPSITLSSNPKLHSVFDCSSMHLKKFILHFQHLPIGWGVARLRRNLTVQVDNAEVASSSGKIPWTISVSFTEYRKIKRKTKCTKIKSSETQDRRRTMATPHLDVGSLLVMRANHV